MRFLLCFIFSAATTAFGTSVGDSYEQVITEKGKPRSQMESGAVRILNYADATIKIRDNVVVTVSAIMTPPQKHSEPAQAPTMQEQITALLKEQNLAVQKIQEIVNQAVAPVQATLKMRVAVCGPDWFDSGITKPDFNKVDVRATQQHDYDRFEYVASKARPETIYRGKELEFNPMTKFFYKDMSAPKKKLTEAEMIEINRLFRIIGRTEKQLDKLQTK
jgi:hypothetical protein